MVRTPKGGHEGRPYDQEGWVGPAINNLGRIVMLYRNAIGAILLALVLCVPIAGARAFDESKYPDFNGQWRRPTGVGNQFDTSKGQGRAQQAPLTPEFQKIFESGLADQ